jgi:hypothetical protein
MVRVPKDGKMDLTMKGNMYKAESTVGVNSHGVMVVHILVTFWIIIFMETVSMNGLMAEYLLETGKIIKWMDMEPLHGQMEENM